MTTNRRPCRRCRSSGMIHDNSAAIPWVKCPDCNGEGWLPITVMLPHISQANDRIRILSNAGPNFDVLADMDEQEATRRLLTQPDLLAACKEALATLTVAVREGIDGDEEFRKEVIANHVTLVQLRTTIAKAEK